MTGVTPGALLPAGALLEANLSTPGQAVIALVLLEPLGAGALDLVTLHAEVPSTAPYRSAAVLDLAAVSLNDGGIPVVADDGVQVVAYFGDATGNATYSALDAQRVLRVAVGLDSGFAAYPTVDPVVVADVTGNGTLSALDGTRVLQKVVGQVRPEIPPLPAPVPPIVFVTQTPAPPPSPLHAAEREPMASMQGTGDAVSGVPSVRPNANSALIDWSSDGVPVGPAVRRAPRIAWEAPAAQTGTAVDTPHLVPFVADLVPSLEREPLQPSAIDWAGVS